MIIIGMIGAMDIEVATLKNKLSEPKVETIAGISFYQGALNGICTVIAKSGIGKVNAAVCTQILIDHFHVTHIINTGIAGAIQHGLGIMDIVVSTDAIYHDVDVTAFNYAPGTVPGMPTVFTADNTLIKAAEEAFIQMQQIENTKKMVQGRIASGDSFVTSSQTKQYIAKQFSAACVEMEGCAIAHTAFINHIPFVIIRCISDNADDSASQIYEFNEKTAAEYSAAFVETMLQSPILKKLDI